MGRGEARDRFYGVVKKERGQIDRVYLGYCFEEFADPIEIFTISCLRDFIFTPDELKELQ